MSSQEVKMEIKKSVNERLKSWFKSGLKGVTWDDMSCLVILSHDQTAVYAKALREELQTLVADCVVCVSIIRFNQTGSIEPVANFITNRK